MKSVIVIGSGFAGLSSATFLAKAGYDVTVLEKNDSLGGRARVWETEANVDNEYIMNQIDSIEKHYTEAFFMHYEGYKYEEIAEHFNIPLGTVKSRIFLARQKMMEKLGDLRY